MFGGSDKGNPGFPGLTADNEFQYDANALPQLQLFGKGAAFEDLTCLIAPTGYNLNPSNHTGNEQAAITNRPVKRYRELETNSTQQQLQVSLNNNYVSFYHDESGLGGQKLVNPNHVSTGLRLSYGEEERNNSSITCSSEGMRAPIPGFALSSSLKFEMDRQKNEFDQYMRLQEANLMKGIRDLKQKQTARLLNSLEKDVMKKLYEKELEIENMNRKNKELTEKIKQLASDTQCWQYKAKFNESIISSLRSKLHEIVTRGPVHLREGFGDNQLDDAASYTNVGNGVSENKLSKCRVCNSREVSVLLMPCRHLCLCVSCESGVVNCPVCQVVKNASVQVYMS